MIVLSQQLEKDWNPEGALRIVSVKSNRIFGLDIISAKDEAGALFYGGNNCFKWVGK